MLLLCVSDYKSMKKRIESNKQIHKKRHSCCMPRLKLLRHKRTHNYLPYKRDNKWAQFYGSKSWSNLRQSKLQSQPLCECCLYHDKITPATQVHHIDRFSNASNEVEMWQKFLSEDNLMSVCAACHKRIHAGQEKNTIDHIWII